ncbi:hypothetical protein L0U85_05445 [Glycomyces sp. L485]|nr:hypothetical protein [Glycomyces sp. L485]
MARTRDRLTAAQTLAYAPEHRPRIDLPLYPIAPLTTRRDWPARTGTGPLLPVHPWQADRNGLGQAAQTWTDAAPLMSLRTVSVGDLHIKCAVDLQLTSAVRHVSAAAAHNGPILSRRLTDPARRCGITVLGETSAITRDAADRPQPHLAAIIRPAPHTLGLDRCVPLAALAEPCPATGRPIAAALAGPDLDAWWTDLVGVALAPLRLFAATGVALEAHGQNTLIAFDGDRPARCVYRDLGGVRVPAADWPHLEGDLACDEEDERIRKLLAALFPTTLTALVDALAAWTGTDPGRWWKTVADAAPEAAAGSKALTAALSGPTWPIKATTAMRLADDPIADLWVSVDNRLATA